MSYAPSPIRLRPTSEDRGRRRAGTTRFAAVWISLALLVMGCATEPTTMSAAPKSAGSSEFATPPFYRIDGHGGATLLLMGTIHLGPSQGWQFSPALREGLARSDRFVFEVDLREATEDVVSTLVAGMVTIEPPDTLTDLLSPETRKLLEERDPQLVAMGMPERAIRWLKPWFIATGLIEAAATRSGFVSSAAAENTILDAIGTRPLIGLETIEQQLEMFDGLSRRQQDVMLRDTLLRLDTAVEEVRALVGAWRIGDEQGLENLARDGIDEIPELEEFYAVLLGERNRQWMTTLRPLAEEREYADQTVFVAVGALHVVGEDGLVALFREAGFAAEPIDHFSIQRDKSL